MLRTLFAAALLLAPCGALAGNPSPLTMQIDRTQEPNLICANRLTSAAGCMPIGSMDANGNFVPFRNGLPLPPFSGDTNVCGQPGTPVVLPTKASGTTTVTVSDCAGAITASQPLQVQASDANIAYNPATGQAGSFTSVPLTIAFQSATFFLAASGVWAVK